MLFVNWEGAKFYEGFFFLAVRSLGFLFPTDFTDYADVRVIKICVNCLI